MVHLESSVRFFPSLLAVPTPAPQYHARRNIALTCPTLLPSFRIPLARILSHPFHFFHFLFSLYYFFLLSLNFSSHLRPYVLFSITIHIPSFLIQSPRFLSNLFFPSGPSTFYLLSFPFARQVWHSAGQVFLGRVALSIREWSSRFICDNQF